MSLSLELPFFLWAFLPHSPVFLAAFSPVCFMPQDLLPVAVYALKNCGPEMLVAGCSQQKGGHHFQLLHPFAPYPILAPSLFCPLSRYALCCRDANLQLALISWIQMLFLLTFQMTPVLGHILLSVSQMKVMFLLDFFSVFQTLVLLWYNFTQQCSNFCLPFWLVDHLHIILLHR